MRLRQVNLCFRQLKILIQSVILNCSGSPVAIVLKVIRLPLACIAYFVSIIAYVRLASRLNSYAETDLLGVHAPAVDQLRKSFKNIIAFPILFERYDQASSSCSSLYFLQDLYCARKVYLWRPERHLDIGSRVDGFVLAISSFTSVDLMDIRPMGRIPGINFIRHDIMSNQSFPGTWDSMSSLHVIEHFGLGRYGDKIDPMGDIKGLLCMSRFLRTSGRLLVSLPFGADRIEFNAHRVYSYKSANLLFHSVGLVLSEFAVITDDREIVESPSASVLDSIVYGIGIYTLVKQ